MGSSLQDQFLKMGLVDKKQVKKNKKAKYKKTQQKGRNEAPDESKLLAQAAQEKQKQKAQQLNRKKNAARQEKENATRIRQLIESHRIEWQEGTTPYNFTDKNTVKKIYVDTEIADRLSKGSLGIVKLAGKYEFIPAAIAKEIQDKSKNQIISWHAPKQKAEQGQEDDPYAEFEVPDDLMW